MQAYPTAKPQVRVNRPWIAYDLHANEVASGGLGFGSSREAIRQNCQPFLESCASPDLVRSRSTSHELATISPRSPPALQVLQAEEQEQRRRHRRGRGERSPIDLRRHLDLNNLHRHPDLPRSPQVFGGVLASLLKRPDTRDGVPAVVRELCARLIANDCEELKEVRAAALTSRHQPRGEPPLVPPASPLPLVALQVGIFRVPGDAKEVADVAAAVNRGGDVVELVRSCSSAHTVAALLPRLP